MKILFNQTVVINNYYVSLCESSPGVQGGCGTLVSEGLDFSANNFVIEHSLERFGTSMPSNRVSYKWTKTTVNIINLQVNSAPRARGVIIKDLIINSRRACAAYIPHINNRTDAVFPFLLGPGYLRYYRNAACAYVVCTAGSDKVIRTN